MPAVITSCRLVDEKANSDGCSAGVAMCLKFIS
jgi:hypothetical protein